MVLLESNVPGFPRKHGKVRDVYDLGDKFVLVATDRISAFDWVLPTGIPDKGKILTRLSEFWLGYFTYVSNHLISTDLRDMPTAFSDQAEQLDGRTMLVTKAKVVPFECVVRGYLAGSGLNDYRKTGRVCGISLPPGLQESQQLPEPIFTPATKAEVGHDENVSFDQMANIIGTSLAGELRKKSLDLYSRAAEYALDRGIIIADTKFEWGLNGGELMLIDEVLTPDSSRFWPADQHRVGKPAPSFDKQYVRDWLLAAGWDKNSPPPELPADVVENTRDKYFAAFSCLLFSED
ncbi:MAG TPA: phosphoribosylaminoimidazolesuccinocarboxamide synthase [Candidatus Andersenbacteria bacterium]|nr:phosphoribosylaminoimidazolesuccinocarboxamide synthase [Candidatus Andersenbacteria bacterium]